MGNKMDRLAAMKAFVVVVDTGSSEWMFAPEIADATVKVVLQSGNCPGSISGPCSRQARTFTQFVQEVMRVPSGAARGRILIYCQCLKLMLWTAPPPARESIRTHTLNGRYRMHSGHCSALARNSSVANDPKRTFAPGVSSTSSASGLKPAQSAFHT
jgi:hypothetical protein